jgi:hypothetical protein
VLLQQTGPSNAKEGSVRFMAVATFGTSENRLIAADRDEMFPSLAVFAICQASEVRENT